MSLVEGDMEQLDHRAQAARASLPVALVSMPFVSIVRPSIQLGLLKAIARNCGFPVKNYHLNLDFAHHIGAPIYEVLAKHRGPILGDWLFSAVAFDGDAPDPEGRLLDEIEPPVEKLLPELDRASDMLRKLRRDDVPAFLDAVLAAIPWGDYRVVGFSSTFQQNVASFALAKRIKQRFPHVCILFGGSNFEGEMGAELVRSVQCIDYAIIGEGDLAFPEFLTAFQEGRDPAEVPGVVCRRNGNLSPLKSRGLFRQMDDLPVPDYEDFFERSESLGLLPAAGRRDVSVLFESSRGCWWGQKQHCTFCGLNGKGMAFRAKSPTRVVAELTELARRNRSFRFEAVDNILDTSYLKNFFSLLAEARYDYQFFYEVKANLTREQLKTFREGGVGSIQPGIESLSSQILKLMRKGCMAIQNVNALRWACYYNIHVGWNLLWGFPGESEDDYQQQLTVLRRITHVQPPVGASRIWMERFSPIFSDRETFPARYVRPERSYGYVYPTHVDCDQVAYFFDYELEDTLSQSTPVFEHTVKFVQSWQAAWKETQKPTLKFWSASGFLQIEDLRDPDAPGTYTFTEPLASLYTASSDRPQSAGKLKELLQLEWPADEIELALDEFCARGLMMRDQDLFLSLALPATAGR